jgi:endonuclease-3 related protein
MGVMQRVFDALSDTFGPQRWWPADTPFEVMVGAVLTQNTAWTNVERALENLREGGLLSPRAIHRLPAEELAELIRPAGYFRVKARRLKNLVALIEERYRGDVGALLSLDRDTLRQELLQVSGIGPETADSIVLYAAGWPIFVVDSYTARVLKRHGWVEPEADYQAIQEYFHGQLAADAQLFNEFHALLVAVAKRYCRTRPRCEECPLQDLLPEGGPIQPE